MPSDVIDPLPNRTAQAARPLQSKRTVMALADIKSDATLDRRVKEGKLPQPVVVNGHRFWFADEVADAINNLPRGQGYKPVAALAERGRRIEERRAKREANAIEPRKSNADRKCNGPNGQRFVGPTARFGFIRRAP